MEIHPECVPCLLGRIIFEAELIDKNKKREIIEEALNILADGFGEGVISAELATKVHRRVYEILDNNDPYKELKSMSNETAEKLLPLAEKTIEKKGFLGAILVSIAGNVLDFGFREDIKSPKYLENEFENIIEEGLTVDHTEKIKSILEEGDDVVFFTDNAGEIVFDTLLLKKIKEYDVHLTVVVKGEPILTDATLEDAKNYEIDKIADHLETTGGFAVGVNFNLLSDELKQKLKNTDLIIAKGMANWESFSGTDYRPIAFLTRSKCKPVSSTMGVPYDGNVVKLFE
ncbi:MAG: damage-control phosphatase ARMT1 family protein [Thermoplasmatota archaeon]